MTDTSQTYGAAIALVSGVYSLVTATTGGMMETTSGALMAVLGVVVVVHGAVLLTPYADRLGGASGPLMVVYALVMLLNQSAMGVTGSANWGMGGGGMSGGGMGGGMGGGEVGGMGGTGMGTMGAGMGWDLGMVALAVLMLASGILMWTDDGSM